jgi:putative transposase
MAARRTDQMARKRHKPEEIIAKLRQVEVLTSQGQSMGDAIRSIGVTEVTYYRWHHKFGGQVKRLKHSMNDPFNRTLSRSIAFLFVLFVLFIITHELMALDPNDAPGPVRWAFVAIFLLGFVASFTLYIRLYWPYLSFLGGENWSRGAIGLSVLVIIHAVARTYADSVIMATTGLDPTLFSSFQNFLSIILTGVFLLNFFIYITYIVGVGTFVVYLAAIVRGWFVLAAAVVALSISVSDLALPIRLLLGAIIGLMFFGVVFTVTTRFHRWWHDICRDVAHMRNKITEHFGSIDVIFTSAALLLVISFFLVVVTGSMFIPWVVNTTSRLLVNSSFVENSQRPYAGFFAPGTPLDELQCLNLPPATLLKFVRDDTDDKQTRQVIVAQPILKPEVEQDGIFLALIPSTSRFRFSLGSCEKVGAM